MHFYHLVAEAFVLDLRDLRETLEHARTNFGEGLRVKFYRHVLSPWLLDNSAR
jgi:hypothetical protein